MAGLVNLVSFSEFLKLLFTSLPKEHSCRVECFFISEETVRKHREITLSRLDLLRHGASRAFVLRRKEK